MSTGLPPDRTQDRTQDLAHRAEGDGWEGILDPEEQVLWQGRPDPTYRFNPIQIFPMVFGLFFAGFALVWMILAATSGTWFWTFGLIHFFTGLSIMLGPVLGTPWLRRHTWYTLTDRRAFIATDVPFRGRTLRAWPIGPDTPLSLHEDGNRATIHFAQVYKRTKNGSIRSDIGFEQIEEGRKVYGLMRGVKQNGLRTEEASE